MIQIIISPAKQMACDADTFAPRGVPPFPHQTERILRALRELGREQGSEGLRRLWAVSERLLAENLDHLRAFEHVPDMESLGRTEVSRRVGAGLFSYSGIQYRSMAPQVLDAGALEWLQGRLWIVSALYGCVRPFDAVQPYRLEMGAKLAIDGDENLYAFWGDRIARAVCDAGGAHGGVELVNLASGEYAKAVLPHIGPGATVTTCVFSSTLRNGRPVQKSTESKAARGSMVRWIAERRIEGAEDLTGFDAGFAYAPELSEERDGTRTLVFMKA